MLISRLRFRQIHHVNTENLERSLHRYRSKQWPCWSASSCHDCTLGTALAIAIHIGLPTTMYKSEHCTTDWWISGQRMAHCVHSRRYLLSDELVLQLSCNGDALDPGNRESDPLFSGELFFLQVGDYLLQLWALSLFGS